MEKDTQLGKDHRRIGAARFARRNYKRGAAAFGRRPPFVVSYSGGLSLIVCSLSISGGYHFFIFF